MSQLDERSSINDFSATEPCVRRVRIRNYKSINKCAIELKRLTVLVGRNGSGKSNFLDALHFVVDGLQSSLDHAIKSRGGIDEVRRRSTGHPRNFAIELDLNLDRHVATYGFEIAGQKGGGFVVKQEQLKIVDAGCRTIADYRLENAKITGVSGASVERDRMPPVAADRLYLVNAAGLPVFREVYDALLTMGFYNLNPERMRELRSPDAGDLLHREGGNISSVIGRLAKDRPEVKQRIKEYLAQIVPGITDIDRVSLGPRETLLFRQKVLGSNDPWKFFANNMSDGTLRATGILVGVMQLAGRDKPVRLVGIEEPETALHPAAVSALMDSLHDATAHTQVVLTSHSPEILDELDPTSDQLLAVATTEGETKIGRIDPAASAAVKDHLYTAGELLRMGQIEPDKDDVARQEQLRFFEDAP